MARQVLPIAGAIIGSFIPGVGTQLGFVIGSIIGNAVDPLEVEGNKIGDNQLQTAAEGGARAIVYGKGCVRATCLIDRGNRQVRKQRDQAGKGGGPVTVNERVYWTFAIGLGEDLIGGGILRIWDREKLVYDATPESTIPEETAEFAEKFRFYDGSETQLPDPALEAIHGIGQTPYYRGTAYVVFPNFDLTDTQESIPTFRWEVASASEGTAGVRWLMSAGFTDSKQVKPSPDGIDWSAPSIDGPSAIAYYRDGSEVLALRQGSDAGFISYDVGDTWESIGIDLDAGIAGPARAAKIGVYWYIASVTNDTWRFNGETSESQGWNSWTLASNGGTLFSIAAASSSNVIGRNSSGTLLWTTPFRVGFGNGATLGANNDEVGILWVDGSNEPRLSTVTIGGVVTEVTCPFTDPLDSGEIHALCYSEELELWVLIQGNQMASGPTLNDLELSPNTLPARALGISEDGNKFVIVGFNRMCVTTIDGQSFNVQTVSNTQSDTALNAVIALDFGADVVGDPVPLSKIVADQHNRAGQDASVYDVSELTDMVAGVVFEQSITYAEAINIVIGPYFADPADYDKQIHYIKRGKPVQTTLTYDDLVDEPETSMRENAIEYPKKLHLFFQSPITAYAATKATSSRSSPDVHVIGESSISVPITYDDPDEPAQISAKLHKVYWTDAEGEIEWHVTDEHIDLVPTDCVGLSLRGIVRRARITRIEDDPGQRKIIMRVDRQSAYTSNVTGIPLPLPTPPQSTIIAPTILAIIDESALTDNSDDLHYVAAMSGSTDVWSGAALQRSLDDGANYGTVNSTTLNAIMGVLQNTVNPASPHYTDTTNTVRVQLYTDDEIDSRSTVQFLSEQGAFALSWDDSNGRRYEFLQARDVDDLGDGLFELSHLLRGVLNTEATEHAPGALFVWLDASLLKIPAQTSWIDDDLTHRAVSNGLSPETAPPQTIEYEGRSQIEWPVGAILSDGVIADDLAVTIIPRHRFGTDVNPIRSINWDGYRINATDGANSETVETPFDNYTFDVTGWSTPIDVTVSQLNRLTGAGPSVTEQFE